MRKQRPPWPRVFELYICEVRQRADFERAVRETLCAERECVEILHEPLLVRKGKKENSQIWRGGQVRIRDADCTLSLIARASGQNSGMRFRLRLVRFE